MTYTEEHICKCEENMYWFSAWTSDLTAAFLWRLVRHCVWHLTSCAIKSPELARAISLWSCTAVADSFNFSQTDQVIICRRLSSPVVLGRNFLANAATLKKFGTGACPTCRFPCGFCLRWICVFIIIFQAPRVFLYSFKAWGAVSQPAGVMDDRLRPKDVC